MAAELTDLKNNFLNLIDENQDLKKELTDLMEENSDLKNEFYNLQLDFVNLEAEQDELKDQLSISQTKIGCLTEENIELKRKLSEPTAQITPVTEVNHEPEPKFTVSELPPVQITSGGDSVDNGSEAALALSIYQKFFVPPLAKNRYRLLSEEEKNWICENADFSETESNIFNLCCEHDSLKEASEKTDLSYSKVKRTSTAIVEKIHIALGHVMTKDMNHEITEG